MRAKSSYTAKEVFEMPRDDTHRYELVRGHLEVRDHTGFQHGRISARICSALETYVTQHALGICLTADVGYWIERNPDTVRIPDVSFIRLDRLPPELPETCPEMPPDLAIEVRSPSDRTRSLNDKIAQYLQTGVRMVWVIEPRTRTVTVYQPGADPVELAENETLDGGAVVPGFRYPIADLFKWPPYSHA
jgi:Uma2 family endonuclease